MTARRVAFAFGILLLLAIAVVSVAVQREAEPSRRTFAGHGRGRALILYHPSRDAHFTDDLALALAQGLHEGGWTADLLTTTQSAPLEPKGYQLIGVVSATYYWTPDQPTLRYLKRARLQGLPAVGVMAGAGSTSRAQRRLERALRECGAEVVEMRSFWLWRPNDEARLTEPNRQVALDKVRQLGREIGAQRAPAATSTAR